MGTFWKNYGSVILMLAGVASGGLLGCFSPEAAHAVKPVGDIFLNILFVLVVPMVFFSVSLSISRLCSGKNMAGLFLRVIAVFLTAWLVAGICGYASVLLVNPIGEGIGLVPHDASEARSEGGQAIVNALTVSDFPQLFSKFNLLPLIIFSVLTGIGVSASGEKGRTFANFLESGGEVTVRTMGVLMKAAPLGLGCYFANTVAQVGASLIGGYLRVFAIYCCCAAILLFVVNPLAILLRAGLPGLRRFWISIIPPSLTALATSSSSAAMPGNIVAARQMGVNPDIADAVVPLSTNLLKAGSTLCAVYKVVFLLVLTGGSISGLGPAAMIIGISMLESLVSGAVTNGGVTGEILTCTLLGVDPSMVGVIMIIGTICDVPATVLNSQYNVVAAALADESFGKR